MYVTYISYVFYFFKDTATTEIYTYLHTLALHDALPICVLADNGEVPPKQMHRWFEGGELNTCDNALDRWVDEGRGEQRSEEHTSELQSLMRSSYDVFCLKKKKNTHTDLNSLSPD